MKAIERLKLSMLSLSCTRNLTKYFPVRNQKILSFSYLDFCEFSTANLSNLIKSLYFSLLTSALLFEYMKLPEFSFSTDFAKDIALSL